MMNTKTLLLALLCAVAVFSYGQEKLIFNEEFNSLNLDTWEHEITMGGGGNWEFEYYTNNRSNSYVKDSVLYLKPTLTADKIGEANVLNGFTMDLWGGSPADQCTSNAFWGCMRSSNGQNIINPVQSARLRTVNSFSFKYGRLEIRAKLPKGDWLWPAIWLLPAKQAYGAWPVSGEIDLVESIGNAKGNNAFASTLHWGPFWPEDPWEKTHGEYTLPEGQTFNDDFHVFGLYWDENVMYSYVDSEENVVFKVDYSEKSFWELGEWGTTTGSDNPWRGRGNAAPFDQEFHLIMNVAVGGVNGYFPDGDDKPCKNTSPTAALDFWNAKDQWYPTWQGEDSAMQVDWVRVYQTDEQYQQKS